MPQACDSLKVLVSISFVVLSKFFKTLGIILFTRDRSFVVRGARVKVYKVLIYRYNFIFSTKEELFFCKQFQSLLSWLLSSWLIWRTGLQHSLYIIFPFCPLFRSSCPPHVPPPPSPASRPPYPQQSCPAPDPPLPCDKTWRFYHKMCPAKKHTSSTWLFLGSNFLLFIILA